MVAGAATIGTKAFGDDWPQWRGPRANNHADERSSIPRRWNLESRQNVLWQVRIPGRGHSTPTIVDDSIYLTTADNAAQIQSLLRLDRETGRTIEQVPIHRGGFPKIHPNNSHASPSVAFDSGLAFAVFHTSDAIWVTAVEPNGRQAWQKRVASFRPRAFQFGYGASPIVEDGLVIVTAEYDGPDSGLYAFEARSGRPVWKTPRPANLNFASPIVAEIAGRRQLLLGGASMIAGYDPANGKLLWSEPAATDAICGTIAWDGRRVLVSGGYPGEGTWCIEAAGPKSVLWQNRVKCYEQSLLTINGYVFGVADSGVAYCWRTQDGQEMWRKRLFGGGISASPVLVDGMIIVASERGDVFLLEANPDRFQLIGERKVGDSLFATPVAVDNRLYVRAASQGSDGRQEFLACIGTA
ncbi:MAG: PQQ-binding-like beta-propeller repeat protein [Planctomycetota bacterium]